MRFNEMKLEMIVYMAQSAKNEIQDVREKYFDNQNSNTLRGRLELIYEGMTFLTR